ncbi:MAG: prepilin peptidase [Rhodospirillales bacterium]|nr:prepilin peptidase [Rhodospirillales bacterium]
MFSALSLSNFTVAAMMALAATGAVNDIRAYRIPNSLNLCIAVLYPIYVLTADSPVDWSSALMIAGGTFAVAAVLFSLGIMGGGDAKMMTVLALWAGPTYILDFVLVTSVVGGVLAIMMMTSARHALALACEAIGQRRLRQIFLNDVLPYGVAIAAGGLVVGLALIAGR